MKHKKNTTPFELPNGVLYQPCCARHRRGAGDTRSGTIAGLVHTFLSIEVRAIRARATLHTDTAAAPLIIGEARFIILTCIRDGDISFVSTTIRTRSAARQFCEKRPQLVGEK